MRPAFQRKILRILGLSLCGIITIPAVLAQSALSPDQASLKSTEVKTINIVLNSDLNEQVLSIEVTYPEQFVITELVNLGKTQGLNRLSLPGREIIDVVSTDKFRLGDSVARFTFRLKEVKSGAITVKVGGQTIHNFTVTALTADGEIADAPAGIPISLVISIIVLLTVAIIALLSINTMRRMFIKMPTSSISVSSLAGGVKRIVTSRTEREQIPGKVIQPAKPLKILPNGLPELPSDAS